MKQLWRIMLTLAICALAAAPARGQEIVAALNLERGEPRPLWFEYVQADNGLVTLSEMETKDKVKYIALYKYGATFRRAWTRQLFPSDDERRIERLDVIGDKIYIFVSRRFARQKQSKVYFYQYNLNGDKLADETEFYTSENYDKGFNIMAYEESINRKKLLCYDNLRSKDLPERSQFFVFSYEDGSIAGNELEFPYRDRDLRVEQVQLANSGHIYILGRLKRGRRVRDPEDLSYILFKYDPRDERLVEIALPFDTLYVTDLMIKPDADDNVLLGGFFSRQNASQATGVLYARFNGESNKIMTAQAADFSEELMSHYLTDRQMRKDRELTDFYLDQIVLRSDGGMLLLAEQYYVTSSSYRDVYGFWYANDTYNYDDVLALSLSPEGKIEWHVILEKEQASDYQGELSYLSLVGPTSMLIFFKTRMSGLGENVYYTRIYYDGQAEAPRPFFEDFGPRDVFYREFSEQISNRKAILALYQGKRKIFSLTKIAF